MDVWAVFKEGVGRQECGGIFSTLELAIQAASTLKDGERDDYHHYEVVPFVVDEPTKQTPKGEPYPLNGRIYTGGELEERQPVYFI